jgi:hypothetical protein
MGDVRDLQ